MNDLTRDSERILQDSAALVRDNREGGRHRRARSIGRGSADLKAKHFMRKLVRILLALFGILVTASFAGMILNGIGFWGVLVTVAAILVATGTLGTFPRMKVPSRAELTKGDARQMVARTELWLEHQRPALPPPAAKIVEDMGVQLDALGLQLETVDQDHPATREVRKLVGEVLPETVDSYNRIPRHLRGEKRAGSSPDEQLTDSLGKISKEIDSVTRQLAEGSLDDLAIKHRYLDYRYGAEIEATDQPDQPPERQP